MPAIASRSLQVASLACRIEGRWIPTPSPPPSRARPQRSVSCCNAPPTSRTRTWRAARQHALQARVTARAEGDRVGEGEALYRLASIAHSSGDPEAAFGLAMEASEIAEQCGGPARALVVAAPARDRALSGVELLGGARALPARAGRVPHDRASTSTPATSSTRSPRSTTRWATTTVRSSPTSRRWRRRSRSGGSR